jgi:hypothetical protein
MNTATLLLSESSEVATMLRQSPIPDLRFLDVEESDAEIVITGLVGSYYLKQLAQETIRPAIGNRRIRNRVLVSCKS